MAIFTTSKVNNDPTNGKLNASEYNQLQDLNNFVLSTGQTPSDSDLNQYAKSSACYGSLFYNDTGTANNYVLSPKNNLKAPANYFDGMIVKFRAGYSNTGASVINVATLGSKDITKSDGITALTAGDITIDTDITLRYDGTVFRLVSTQATTLTKGLSLLPSQIIISINLIDIDNDIDFSGGNFQFSDGTGQAIAFPLTKRLDASWVAGNNQGGLDTGSKSNSTWYHCYAIYNPTTFVSDYLFSKGAITPTNLPNGFTKYKRLGSIKTNSNGNILYFVQKNKEFYFTTTNPTDFSGTPPSTLTNLTITAPLGIKTKYIFAATILQSGSTVSRAWYFYEEQGGLNTVCDVNSSSNVSVASTFKGECYTNTSSQIQHRMPNPTAGCSILQLGWEDYQL